MIHLISFSLTFLLCFFSLAFSTEESFLMINGESGEDTLVMGSHVEERLTPCSTFKIALSLMGFDSGILQDEKTPVWLFQEGYDDFLQSWKSPQTPQTWMKTSCVWFSRVLAGRLGMEKFQFYLARLGYGNQDASGGLTNAWLASSLKISPREQATFIHKILREEHPVSSYALSMTKQLLFLEDLPSGWKLFGKTGLSKSTGLLDDKNELGWFIGWIEKGNHAYPFAYAILENKITPQQRVPRVKQLLAESNVLQR